jgi:hypothetical protein
MPQARAKRFRLLAIEARSVAEQMTDEAAREEMLSLAARYDVLADRIEEREGDEPPRDKDE